MSTASDERPPYVVPRYLAAGDPPFYHVLHGWVPGHQIDFIHCPVVPQGPLTQTHFGHVARLLRHVEPREGAPFAFVIGNLSRDDVQHEPGHGGLGLIFCRRASKVVDHAGRTRPPYAHGLLAIDRALDAATLFAAAVGFHDLFVNDSDGGTCGFYEEYVRSMRESPGSVKALLDRRMAQFAELPRPGRSRFGADFLVPDGPPPPNVTVLLPDGDPFRTVASVAARLAAVLHRSNVRWTAISSGRELEIPGGASIRLIPQSAAPRGGRGLVLRLRDLPSDDAALAEKLFSAKPQRLALSSQMGPGRRPVKKEEPSPAARRESREVIRPVVPDEAPPVPQRPGGPRRAVAGGGAAIVAVAGLLALWRFGSDEPRSSETPPDQVSLMVPPRVPPSAGEAPSAGGAVTSAQSSSEAAPATGNTSDSPSRRQSRKPSPKAKKQAAEGGPKPPVTEAPSVRQNPCETLDDPRYCPADGATGSGSRNN